MIYKGKFTKEISFPLGGIGSGSIGLAGNGALRDFEIFNRPSKGSFNGFTNFAVKAVTKGDVFAKILNGDMLDSFSGIYGRLYGSGAEQSTMCGFPHFENHEFNGEFPIAEITFSDRNFPGKVMLRAFNPFIPLDEDNSSIPGAFFEIIYHNTTDEEIEFHTAFSVCNPYTDSENVLKDLGDFKAISLVNKGVGKDSTEYGDLTFATDSENSYSQCYWYRGTWNDDKVTFWNNFNSREKMPERIYSTEKINKNNKDHATLGRFSKVSPGEEVSFRFVLTWNVPNNYNYWDSDADAESKLNRWKNYYAVLFEDSAASAEYSLRNWDVLYGKTDRFRKALYSSTIDSTALDAAASSLSVLKTATVLRLQDGSFYGWEGLNQNTGSCEGTCQHVWNYAYALCFLFPRLERSLRQNEFDYEVLASGHSYFRMKLPLDRNPKGWVACLDGQTGMVIKSFREWKISGDDSFLKKNWDKIKLVLDYAVSSENPHKWDENADGVLEGRQHHTLDMELFGPSAWLQGMYLAALKCASQMAEYLGEEDTKVKYLDLFEKGRKWTAENLFNGRYFIQKIDLSDKSVLDRFDASDYWNEETGEIKYQIGEGCSIDQLLGQWHADLLSIGDIFDKELADTALDSIFDINFVGCMRNFANPWRVFALNEESGTVICGYPDDVRKPKIPVPYCEEVMTGFEYAYAGELIFKGKTEKGLRVIKAVRDRYDGEKRNPYNEIECGCNYARVMAAFALLPAFSGFSFHLPKGYIGFNPVTDGDFRCVFSLGTGWGEYIKTDSEQTVRMYDGSVTLTDFGVASKKLPERLFIDGKETEFTFNDGVLSFNKTEIINELTVKFF